MATADIRRRWGGVLCLGTAILMVVWGQFFLPPHWDPVVQILFWLLCFVFTTAAILIALWDLACLRQRTRAEKRELLEKTLRRIEEDARTRQAQQ